MAAVVYLDTLTAVRLFEGRPAGLPPYARRLIESGEILISPMAILEIEYLFEIQRVRYSADAIVHSLQVDAGLRICDLPFEEVVLAALKEAWTRDPFDRIIVSHAVARKAPLITKDQTILDHCPLAVWDSKR